MNVPELWEISAHPIVVAQDPIVRGILVHCENCDLLWGDIVLCVER